ncbi:FAD-dependent oxidoreductase (plasmid) [Tistrella mobilis]|uniref:NAD(P)/FAD-dependent oxidoreductase n=1 Tax=Tistrella mobilis TaxID=171437 RepID=UPI003555F2A7
MKMSPIVIIGGGQAGGAAALALRRHGATGPITLIGREPLPPYERPALSKGLLLGETAFEKLVVLPETVAAEQAITLRLGTTVTAIDRAAQTVTTDAGEVLPYGTLILATGGRARELQGLAPDGRDIFAIRTAADAEGIRERMGHARSLLVIGGGWLGLEVAASARKTGLDVTLVEAGPRLCGRVLPPAVSAILADLHTRRGVDLRLGDAPVSLTAAEGGVSAHLASGAVLAADMAVVAVGLTVEDDLARAAGLATADGILTDAAGRTEDPAIFAIGDVARTPHPAIGTAARLESWQMANLQAEAAARAILNLAVPPAETPWFWSDQYDLNLQILGLPDMAVQPIRRGSPETGRGSLLWLDPAERLRAVIALNAPRDIAMARRLIGTGLVIDRPRAADPAVPLKDAVFRAA